MKIITLLNEKGGVGKTTCAIHLAAGLAIRGYKVILVDADPQGNATYSLGLPAEAGLYNLLVRDAEFKDVARLVQPEVYEPPDMPARGFLLVIPSNIETRNIANMISDPFTVYSRFQEISRGVDIVIFDTAPTPSLFHGSIFIASDGIIFPSELEALSLNGLISSLGHLQQFDNARHSVLNKRIKTMGIVPTKVRTKTVEHSENLQLLQQKYGDLVWPSMPMRITWAEANMQRRPVYSYAPDSAAAGDAWMLVDNTIQVLEYV